MIEAHDSFQPNEYLYVTRDEVEIIDYLVDNGEMFTDFSKNRVCGFMKDEDFCLVMYFALAYDRGFVMYVVKDFTVNVRTMMWLSKVLHQMQHEGVNEDMMWSALHLLDNMISMAATLRAAMGKQLHAEENEYEYY